MHEQNRSPQTLALAQLCELAQRLTPEAGRGRKRTVRTTAATLRQLEATSTLIYTTTEEACARLLNVSYGLIGILQLLEVWSEHVWECRCLHCLLLPLKLELDGALSDIQKML
ncbi:DUF1484 domain-containing protein [Ralstonia solanacearum]|uniref:DUF1484 domain-containing protein n=1 Tax=Ralstonia solanacearum TaxID=305 RepID=UPI0005029BFA|nr:DUF1484 domain-containing protein [Ralstonia solanacearum]KFX76763.1 hypothetical protein KR98_22945 [Ralstonia solanacearum]MBB6589928.1 DUF1484 domain-containing protein [Ralstonia solanacearum]MBB6594124.1 DUF1484 domain-containing protein [Ralstonia solanacearum]MDB0540322.1 DUF1484 domain-containing protein [Ralstonia solanacearum]MDB0550688.1 DUF1484 domain-containing protein [Ralstonia solanacearum]